MKEEKQTWIRSNCNPKYVFGDITKVTDDGRAIDIKTQELVKIPPVDLIFAGVSCTDASALNAHRADRHGAVAEGSHSTGSTFRGLMKLADVLDPKPKKISDVKRLNEDVKRRHDKRKEGVEPQNGGGSMNTYGSEGPRRESCEIRGGGEVWREFCHVTAVCSTTLDAVALFDKHDVVDTLSRDEAIEVGIDFEHDDKVAALICSYGFRHREETFDRDAEFYPFVAECDGHIFTDYREGYRRWVDIYRERWMPTNVIGVRGDKGQIASLLARPALLFDDKESNIDLVRRYSTPAIPMDGVVVRRGRKQNYRVEPGYYVGNDPRLWLPICRWFGANHAQR